MSENGDIRRVCVYCGSNAGGRRVFREAAETGRIPQAPQLADDLGIPECEVRTGLRALGRAKVLILSPNDDSIWAANPFCAVPSGIRVDTVTRSYWAICVWDALGISAALSSPSSPETHLQRTPVCLQWARDFAESHLLSSSPRLKTYAHCWSARSRLAPL